jgi:membrane protein implicated in regulation of membrane protease activity
MHMTATMWLLVCAFCFGIEISAGSFWFLWFGLAALIDCALVFFGLAPSLPAQLLIFSGLNAVFLFFTRPLLLKFLGNKEIKSNVSAMIGQMGICTLAISPHQFGQVKVRGEIWTAFSDREIEEGAAITVEKVEGVKLKVRVSEPRTFAPEM